MTRLEWGNPEDRMFEFGVDRGVLNVHGTGTKCVPWNGMVSVEETFEARDPHVTYLDGVKIVNANQKSDYQATLSALYSPEEFDECDGTLDSGRGLYSTNNISKKFNFSFRSKVGPYDYKIHFVYNALAVPAQRSYKTVNDSVDLDPISWDITTQPVVTDDGKVYGAHHYVDTSKSNLAAVWAIENLLYGTESTHPRFPTYTELQDTLSTLESVQVTVDVFGRWTINASDDVAYMIDSIENIFGVDWSGLSILDHGIFKLRGN